MRGISNYHIPSSLPAMIDPSIIPISCWFGNERLAWNHHQLVIQFEGYSSCGGECGHCYSYWTVVRAVPPGHTGLVISIICCTFYLWEWPFYRLYSDLFVSRAADLLPHRLSPSAEKEAAAPMVVKKISDVTFLIIWRSYSPLLKLPQNRDSLVNSLYTHFLLWTTVWKESWLIESWYCSGCQVLPTPEQLSPCWGFDNGILAVCCLPLPSQTAPCPHPHPQSLPPPISTHPHTPDFQVYTSDPNFLPSNSLEKAPTALRTLPVGKELGKKLLMLYRTHPLHFFFSGREGQRLCCKLAVHPSIT